MAIQGTIVLEDHIIQFRVAGDSKAVVTVTDTFDGEEETYSTSAADFMVALGAALHFSGKSLDTDAAERAQPGNPSLRFIW